MSMKDIPGTIRSFINAPLQYSYNFSRAISM